MRFSAFESLLTLSLSAWVRAISESTHSNEQWLVWVKWCCLRSIRIDFLSFTTHNLVSDRLQLATFAWPDTPGELVRFTLRLNGSTHRSNFGKIDFESNLVGVAAVCNELRLSRSSHWIIHDILAWSLTNFILPTKPALRVPMDVSPSPTYGLGVACRTVQCSRSVRLGTLL